MIIFIDKSTITHSSDLVNVIRDVVNLSRNMHKTDDEANNETDDESKTKIKKTNSIIKN
jgi:hypothetical protein